MQASTPPLACKPANLRTAISEQSEPRKFATAESSFDAFPWVVPLDHEHFAAQSASPAGITESNRAGQRSVVAGRPAETTQLAAQSNDVVVAGDAWFGVDFGFARWGSIRKVEVGPVTDDISQSNRVDQQISVVGRGAAPTSVEQISAQLNGLAAEGEVGAIIYGHRAFIGSISGIEVGLVTGELDQENRAMARAQLRGSGPSEVEQAGMQANLLDVQGSVWVTMEVHRIFAGAVQRIEVGLLSADVQQTGLLSQRVSSVSVAAEAEQAVQQGNLLEVWGQLNFFLDVRSSFTGRIRDVEIGLVTGEIVQRNEARQEAIFTGRAAADAPASAEQSTSQLNLISASGGLDAMIRVEGHFKGIIEDVEIGLITADITQTNLAGQQLRAAIGAGGDASALQSIQQWNSVEVHGDLSVSLVIDGNFTGRIQNLEIGLLTGNVDQVHLAGQIASFTGAAPAVQTAQQENHFHLDLLDDVNINIVFDGPFSGVLENLSIGLIFAEVEQGNFSLQQTTSTGSRSAAASMPDLASFMTRNHSFDPDGQIDLDVEIRIGSAYAAAFSHLDIGIEWIDLLGAAGRSVWM